MPCFAELDENDIVTGVSMLYGDEDSAKMIRIPSWDGTYMNKKYNCDTSQFEPCICGMLKFLTNPPYYTGITTLQFELQDLEGNKVISAGGDFVVLINEVETTIAASSGVLEFDIDCHDTGDVSMSISKFRYIPFSTTLVVIEA